VGHLLLWVAACSVYIAAVRAALTEKPDLVGLGIVALQAIGHGAALAGAAVFVWRRVRGRPWPIEPGEWLLAVLGGRLAAELVIYDWLITYLRSPGGFVSAITCCLLVLPLLSRRLEVPWKVFFLLMLLLFARPTVEVCFAALKSQAGFLETVRDSWLWLEQNRAWILLPLAGAITAYEIFRRRQRTWLHWVGVATLAWYLSLLVLSSRR
jgi:hypothetical protein